MDFLSALPNEIVRPICEYLIGDTQALLLTNNEAQARSSFENSARSLRNLCLTSRRFLPVAQETLSHTAIVCESKFHVASVFRLPSATVDNSTSSIAQLVRTLLDRPDLRSKVKKLYLVIPPRREPGIEARHAWMNHPPHFLNFHGPYIVPTADSPSSSLNAILLRAAVIIQNAAFSDVVKTQWEEELFETHIRPLCGVLLALTPTLQYLELVNKDGIQDCTMLAMMPFRATSYGRLTDKVPDLGLLPALKKIKHLRLRSNNPVFGVGRMSKLETLDMTFCYGRKINRNIFKPDFANIHTLRVDCRLLKLHHETGYWRHRERIRDNPDQFGAKFIRILRMVPNLRNLVLYDENNGRRCNSPPPYVGRKDEK
jgi:hypothetical protein